MHAPAISKHQWIVIAATLLLFSSPSSPLQAQEAPGRALPLPGESWQLEGHWAFVILPDRAGMSDPTPWVWYAPHLHESLPGDAERWMFERFIAAGIAIAGIDVGESCGNPSGREIYSSLYRELTEKRHFARQPIFLARSRGGLMALNWAVENPQNVGGFAGIYPVSNLVSYPGLATASAAYGMTPEELESHLAAHNPIERLAPLAKARVPLFVIHGDADKTVPLELNSGELQRRYRKLGGHMQLIVSKGQRHDMWPGFFQSQELVDFVIKSAQVTSDNK